MKRYYKDVENQLVRTQEYKRWRKLISSKASIDIAMLNMGVVLWGEEKFNFILQNNHNWNSIWLKMMKEVVSARKAMMKKRNVFIAKNNVGIKKRG